MTSRHGDRDHATWSASATARNWHCAGALALAPSAPPQRESIHAANGTACHQIAERCLIDNKDAIEFLDSTAMTKEHKIEIDEEIVNSAQEYIDYVRVRGATAFLQGGFVNIEQHFDLAALNPPFDAGGTGDAVVYFPEDNLLEVIDLKHGRGYVDADGNPQLRTYALGALLANPGIAAHHVRVTIVQPRVDTAKGRIRSETIHVADLLDWTTDLLAAMRRSKQAADEYAAARSNSVLLGEWADKWLTPGKCVFCPVEGCCPKLRKGALDVAAVWFDDRDQPQIGNSALDTSAEALARDLDMIPMLEDWIRARRALAHSQADGGVEIPGYQLVDKIGHRKWIGDDEDEMSTKIIDATRLCLGDIQTSKLKTPAQLEKVLGAKRKNLIADLYHRPKTGTNLVSIEKTTRPATKGRAEQFFENPTE